MRRRRRKTDTEDVRQQAQHLIDVALDESATLEERRTNAMRAIKHIDKYDLLSVPFEDNETVRAAMNIAETISSSNIVGNVKKLIDEAKRRRR